MNKQKIKIGDEYLLRICIVDTTDKHYEVEIIRQQGESSCNHTVTYILKSELENLIKQ